MVRKVALLYEQLAKDGTAVQSFSTSVQVYGKGV